MQRMRIRILVAAALLTVVAVGFVSALGIFARDATPAPAPARTTATTGTPRPSLASRGPAAAPGKPRGPVIVLVDVAFSPRGFSIPANAPTVVTLVNRGAVAHNFTIDELNVRSGDLRPGQATTVTVDAPAGAYAYYCAIPGHRQAGMVGTLTVA
jgi:uncharacterized cupredoxin-like copper-binding protein